MSPVLACQEAELAGSKFQPSALTLEREQSIRRLGGGVRGGGEGVKEPSVTWSGVPLGVAMSPFFPIETMELLTWQ